MRVNLFGRPRVAAIGLAALALSLLPTIANAAPSAAPTAAPTTQPAQAAIADPTTSLGPSYRNSSDFIVTISK